MILMVRQSLLDIIVYVIMNGINRWLLLLGIFTSVGAQAEPQRYVVDIQILAADRQSEYCPTLLKMILHASKAPDEVIEFNFSDRRFSQARWFAEVQRNATNSVIWTVTNKDREALLRPIRVPIYKGLLGNRVLVIRDGEQARFANIKTLSDLSTLIAGQGMHWPDTDIMQANGLPVITSNGTESLYPMLRVKRFDYFPRGIFELTSEVGAIQANNLVAEKEILLSYPLAMYFFVNKNNIELAERIEKGWAIILKNGAFDKFFFSQPKVVAALQDLKKHKRHVIHLQNPYLSTLTPTDRPEYWLDISKYK